MYCDVTERAVVEFQQARGLRITGLTDQVTWSALVEASWTLGERVLFHSSPNLRGDDVAALQALLARLGFDCGRVDGIFGPATSDAVADFQRNCGLPVDGACGRETVQALHQLSRHTGVGPGIGAVREMESLRRAHSSLRHRRVVVGHFGGVAPLTRAVARALRAAGAEIITLDDPDPPTQAAAANRYDADVYLGFEAHARSGIEIAYYSVPTYTSPGGARLGDLLGQFLPTFAGSDSHQSPGEPQVMGMRLPILRETRMPAVMITLGPVRLIVDHASDLAHLVVRALELWCQPPLGE